MSTLRQAALFLALLLLPLGSFSPAQTPGAMAKPSAGISADLLDINTATPNQLKTLNGIGDAYAKRIIDGRPYLMKTQLVTRGVLPQAVYDKIKSQIIAHRVKP